MPDRHEGIGTSLATVRPGGPDAAAYGAAPAGEPLHDSALGAALLEVARRRGRATAVVWPQDGELRSWSFTELMTRARAAAAEGLLRILHPGERLAIWSANSPNWLVAEIGAALAGVVLVPMNPSLTRNEAVFLLRDSGARAVLAGEPWRGRDLHADAAAIASQTAPAPAVLRLEAWCDEQSAGGTPLPTVEARQILRIQYTSGTTGTPKGALVTHLMGTNVGPISFRGMQLGTADVIFSPLPFHHVGGSLCQARWASSASAAR